MNIVEAQMHVKYDVFKGIRLRQLFTFGLFISGVSYILAYGALLVLIINLIYTPNVEDTAKFIHVFLNTKAFNLIVLFFCGMIMSNPSGWIIELATDPQKFFSKEYKPSIFKRYKPKTWLYIWVMISILVYEFIGRMSQKYPDLNLFYDAVHSNLNIVVASVATSIFCIGIIQNYKKRIASME